MTPPLQGAPGVTDTRQRAVLVLGAGRSGTSIVTRAMQAVGVDLGDDFKPPSRKNPTGFFEDAALLKLSKRLRRTLGLRPDSLRLLDDEVWTSPAVMPFYEEFSATIDNTGAGRSGTSIVTRAMQAVGVDLGDDFKPPSRKNPTGFFEDAALLKLSKRLRRTLGLRPDSLRLLDDEVWTSPAVMPFYEEFSATIDDRFAHVPIWGFKYARTMRLLPFWERLFDIMNIAPSYVMPIRNPLSVARSRARLDTHRGTQANSDLEWLVNVVPYFDRVHDANLVVIDYDNLIENPAAQSLRQSSVGSTAQAVIRD